MLSVTGDMMVGDASKARKRALAGLQKVHEAATRERKTNDLGAIRVPLNRPTQKDQSSGLNSRKCGSPVGGLKAVGNYVSGPQIEIDLAKSEAANSSCHDRSNACKVCNNEMDGLNVVGPGLNGLVVESDVLRGSTVAGRNFNGQCDFGPRINSADLMKHGGVASGSILKNQGANVNNFVENDLNKLSNDSKSTWASLFGTSSEESLFYTPPKAIGDKIVVIPPEEVIDQGIQVWENSLVGQLIDAKLPYAVIQRLKPISLDFATKKRRRLSYARVCVELEGGSNMSAEITVSLRGVDFNVSVNYEWKPRKCNLCCAFGHSSSKCSRSVESKTIQEEVVHKGDDVDFELCGEVVLESFKQVEKGEIRSSPNRHDSQVEKGVGKSDEFTLVTRKKSELVSIRDRGKSMEVIMPNSFGSLLEVGDADKWALSIIEGSSPPLQVDEGTDVLSGISSSIVGFCCLLETRVREGNFDSVSRRFSNSWDYSCSYSNSGVGRIWVMWKKNRFSFSTHVMDEQFVTGTLTDLLSGVCVEVFCVYASNSNIERRLLWHRLVEITSAWSSPGVVMEDFNAIRVHSEAFRGSPIQGEMEDFNLAIRDADLVEPSVQGNWFTWTSKVQGSGMLRRLDRVLVNDDWLSTWPTMLVNVLPWGISDHYPILFYPSFQHSNKVVSFRFFNHWVEDPSFIEVVTRMWSRHEGVSPLVRLMRNLHLLKPILRRRFGRHIKRLSEEVRIVKEAMDIAQREMAVNYFRNSLGSQEIGYRELSPVIDDIVQFQWSEECCQALQLPISREEVRRVLFSMDSGKAPGPDGFSVVGINATAITLIPKHNGAERLEDFHPISCYNVLYKCISKILADRLRVWLPSFISSNQSAFIPGRSIIENILLCQELIRACVTSPMFPIMINGSLEGFFHGRKGVRQGDPLSPFLFVMVMEVLSRMLNKIPQSFQFHHRCEKVKLTHLTFADDLMIFCAADELSIRFIRDCLQKFGELSGLFANPRKSSIFVAGVNNENASHLATCMGFARGNLPVRYLGLPLLTGRLRSNDCAPLIQRITSQIRSWNARVLSFAGRLQLVRSVLRSLQVYWASVFVLPAYVHNEVDKILRSYLWRGKEEGRGGIKVAWVDVCLPFEEGGFGIRDGPSWNIASTLKILWLMLTNSGSLWVAWVEAYILKGRSLWDVDSRVGRSWCLWAILRGCHSRADGVWLWPRVSLELIDLWERVQEVSPCLSVSDSRVWVRGRQGGFSISSAWEAIRPRGGRVLWDGFFGSWLPHIGLGIGGLSCLGFVIRGVLLTLSIRVVPAWMSFGITTFLGLHSSTGSPIVLGVPLGSPKTRYVPTGSHVARVRERASSWAKVKVEESWRATEEDP
ncbi:uncharacterized protein E6C27_scaffold581G00620 [Cucumis melo var. makuwa]|uniref:Reverse transcriptase domain-containing protein n=1 Tax=Cucumis melo var. makuwa TaxID=1194695 RepID=A0A5A7SPE5_CUCMM|nr:uncharacterized protein E6C27_scaffold581G00620 [Cucumis melo var. makuwa]